LWAFLLCNFMSDKILKSDMVPPFKPDYPNHLESYIDQINEAIRKNKHHDHRRNLFLNFLRLAYDVDPVEVEIEEKVKVANIRGNIDALFKYLIFEFKSNIDSERPAAEIEIKKYLQAQEKPSEFLALLTDGIKFEIYQTENGDIEKIREFTLSSDDPLLSYRNLDDLIFSAKKVTPKAQDITSRFGAYSAIFRKSFSILKDIYATVENNSTVQIKLQEWNILLSKVYGEMIGEEGLFIKHTYLAMFSRLLVLNALYPKATKSRNAFKGLITGKFFSRRNLPNLVEEDFFSWALNTEAESEFIDFLIKLDKYFRPFRLDNISEDILKEIYQELIDPESRHSLGEYYTPDWIADIALERIGYEGGKILDPACGSGSFLLAVIRKLRKNGCRGNRLVKITIESIIGLDVHPVAVLMTKANILIGLANEFKKFQKEIYLPIYMADTLIYSREKIKLIPVEITEEEQFQIPIETTSRNIQLDEFIDKFALACQNATKGVEYKEKAWRGFLNKEMKDFSEGERFLWRHNFLLFIKLIKQKRDSIWKFILKNAYRPAFLQKMKIDYVVGNPPWLAYRYIKNKGYRKKVKDLTGYYELIKGRDVKLFTQMDTSTLFFCYCQDKFLTDNGKIAFVLPKTTVLPAKQHIRFQKIGFSEIHDFSNVAPLFNVRSVLLIRDKKKTKNKNIPQLEYTASFPQKNMNSIDAKKYIKVEKSKTTLPRKTPQKSHYYNLFLQGATIVPRCFWFIQKDKDAAEHREIPYVVTSDAAFGESKENWRVKLEGRIEKSFIYETILSKGLIPFGIISAEPIFLPILEADNKLALLDSSRLMEEGYTSASEWLEKAEKLWLENRSSEDRTLIQWLNYNQKLTKQSLSSKYVVIYNTSGTNLAAALYVKGNTKLNSFKSNGLLTESVTYYFYPKSQSEGLYLTSILNSDVVNKAIKAFQPQGLYGERHIHRRPFEVCAIPRYDPKNRIHRELADLAESCIEEIKPIQSQLHGRIGKIRTEVRKLLKNKMAKINGLVEELLIEAGQDEEILKSATAQLTNGDLFKSN